MKISEWEPTLAANDHSSLLLLRPLWLLLPPIHPHCRTILFCLLSAPGFSFFATRSRYRSILIFCNTVEISVDISPIQWPYHIKAISSRPRLSSTRKGSIERASFLIKLRKDAAIAVDQRNREDSTPRWIAIEVFEDEREEQMDLSITLLFIFPADGWMDDGWMDGLTWTQVCRGHWIRIGFLFGSTILWAAPSGSHS